LNTHQFLFTPGYWIGEGKITFSSSPSVLRFYTRWHIAPIHAGMIDCQQEVEMQEQMDVMRNFFSVSEVTAKSFAIELSSSILGTVTGKGIIDTKTIAWEFHHANQAFEGFEVYELKDNGEYMLHAEYASTDQLRTIIDGRIWRKVPSAE
jgi:hypothetical protein